MSIIDAWRDLYRRHFSLVPLKPQGKKALVLWTGYQKERASADTVKGWLKLWPDANPGIITGWVSGVIVLDVDGALGMKTAIEAGRIPDTPKVKTAHGYHLYFAYPDLHDDQRVITKAGVMPGLDSRGDGGYVVAPGAIHETGALYRWEVSPDECEYAQAPQWWLDLVVTTEPDPYAQVKYEPRKSEPAEPDRARPWLMAALSGEIAKCEAAPDGTKHDRALKSAIALGGFVPYLDEGEIMEGLFNALAYRAKDKHALRKTIRDGIDYGSMRPREIPEPKEKQVDHSAIGRYSKEPPTEPGGESAAIDRWEPVPITDLVPSEECVPWYWTGYVAPATFTQITGLWKSGKSTLLGNLYAELGKEAGEFGGLATSGCKVLVVSEESARHWISRREELHLGAHVHLLCKPFLGNPDKAAWGALLETIGELVSARGYGLVVFDSLPNLWAVRDENDAAQVREAVVPMNALTERGAGVVLVCHPSKGDMTEGRATRGSGLLSSFVDIIVEMRRLTPDDHADTRRTLTAYSRFEETPAELVLEYMPGYGYEPRGNKQEAERAQRQWTLQGILPTQGPGATVDEVLEEWPANEHRPAKGLLRSDLGYLCAQRTAWIRSGKGTRADPFRYWYSAQNEQWQRSA